MDETNGRGIKEKVPFMFYVGVSNDPLYPGIIAGPFLLRMPKLQPGHFLYVKEGEKFRLISVGMSHMSARSRR